MRKNKEMPRNYTGFKPRGEDVTLVGRGPSREPLFKDPTLAIGPVALAGSTPMVWPHECYMAITSHPDRFPRYWKHREKKGWPQPEWCIGNMSRSELNDVENYLAVPHEVWRGGSSALYALEVLAGIGYRRFHVYGVDLDIRNYWRLHAGWFKVTGVTLYRYGTSLSWLDKSGVIAGGGGK